MIFKNALKIIFHLWDWVQRNFFKGACQISVRKGPNNLFTIIIYYYYYYYYYYCYYHYYHHHHCHYPIKQRVSLGKQSPVKSQPETSDSYHLSKDMCWYQRSAEICIHHHRNEKETGAETGVLTVTGDVPVSYFLLPVSLVTIRKLTWS